MPCLAAALLLLGVLSNDGWGEEEEAVEGNPEHLQEFFVSESVYPQEKGELQLTLSPRYLQTSAARQVQAILSPEYGFTDSFQFEIELPVMYNARRDDTNEFGLNDIEVAFKNRFVDSRDLGLQFSAGLGFGFPAGSEDKGLGEGNFEFEPFVVVSREIGSGMIQFHGAYGLPHNWDEKKEGRFNLAGLYPVGPVRLVLEANASLEGTEFGFMTTPGIVWIPKKPWELSLGVPIGITEEKRDFQVVGMMTYEFNTRGNP